MVLFQNVADSQNDKNKYQSALYLKNTEIFDFGSTFITTSTESSENKSFEIETLFNLVNISNVLCDVTFTTLQDCGPFQFSPDTDIIPRGSKKALKLIANPIKPDLYEDTLLISIKDNPKIEIIKMSLLGYDFAIDVSPKNIIFEKVTTNTSISKEITITNSTPIKLRWSFGDFDNLFNNSTYTLSQIKGNLEPLSIANVLLSFKPEADVLFNTKFKLKVLFNLFKQI